MYLEPALLEANNGTRLFPMKEEHLETVRLWRNSEEISRFMYSSDHISEAEQLAWFRRQSAGKESIYWMIALRDQLMGVVNLADISSHHSRASWAFYLGNPEARGKGLGAAVEFLILTYFFDTLDFHKLCCEVLTSNESVIRMHQKFGFQIEGTRIGHIRKGDSFHDIVEMAILKDEWQARKPKLIEKYGF